MTINETAVYLSNHGYRCAPATVRSLCREARLSYFRVGLGRGRFEVTEAEADRFLEDSQLGRARGGAADRTPTDCPIEASGGMTPDWRLRWDDSRRQPIPEGR